MSLAPALEFDGEGLYRTKVHTTAPARFDANRGWRAEVAEQSTASKADPGYQLQRAQFQQHWPSSGPYSATHTTIIDTHGGHTGKKSDLATFHDSCKRVGVGSVNNPAASKEWRSVTGSTYGHEPETKNETSASVAMALGYGPTHRHYHALLTTDGINGTNTINNRN